MKGKIHILGAILGLGCAAAFAMVPFTAKADAGPAKPAVASKFKTVKDTGPIKPAKKHIKRGNVAKKDDGCAE